MPKFDINGSANVSQAPMKNKKWEMKTKRKMLRIHSGILSNKEQTTKAVDMHCGVIAKHKY
ncbi:hypothetical protein KIH87_09765 [Paraneptunicella aestuarii]|uniref:hypothetical protein n=1 Tax=Paraneptunicella aestuarii TaxID=2831148 RepID=UPI001E42C4AF|nr:hypothetical protein [Paraneptunicella aestuarii]UAA40598.1 hypothetical protein KIH87_09765 [Paraneptunicella aestuarii]